MGINLGDIIIEDDGDIYGDGVNVAARLQQIAEPGSVFISGKVFDEVEGKVATAFAFKGEQTVKNLTRAVRVYSSKGAPGPTAAPMPLPPPVTTITSSVRSNDKFTRRDPKFIELVPPRIVEPPELVERSQSAAAGRIEGSVGRG